MDITRLYNYYPSVDLSDLSNVFSNAAFTNGNKLCVISYLPKILRIGDTLTFINKYVLFLEDTDTVDNIVWSYTLHNDETTTTDTILLNASIIRQNEYLLVFDRNLLDANQELKFNRLVVNCSVTKGAEVIDLEMEHSFVKTIGVDTLFTAISEHKSFIGNPDTTNFLVNYIRDYFPKTGISWNKIPVTLSGTGDDSLMNYVASLLYYKTLTFFDTSVLGSAYYDIARHDNLQIEALILSDSIVDAFENTANGICELPLHLLSDMAGDLIGVPDFNIDSNNKIYQMLSRALVFGPDIENYTLNETESKRLLKESRERFVAQKLIFEGRKVIDLYHLTRFPKSSIKLSAILFKFLLKASQKNACKETLYKDISWQFLTLDAMKTHENLIKNIYSHYLEGPVNKVLAFRRPARTCAQYAWSPYVYTIINFLPRVTNAYFAKKLVVKNDKGELLCFFKRIDSRHKQKDSANADLPFDGILGREVYIVVETIDLEGKDLVCQIRPEKSTLTGNTNKMPVIVNGAQADEHTIEVGDFTPLENNAGSSAHYINLEKHHSDKAFIRLYVRPQNRATFDVWTTNLNNSVADNRMVNLHISVRLASSGEAYFGQGPHGTTGIFLDTVAKGNFRVVNRTFYEIFERSNAYNYLQLTAGDEDKRIGKIRNNRSADVVYYYHDLTDNEHWICECNLFTPRRRANGIVVHATSNPVNIPPGFINDTPAPGGDAVRNYYYANDDIITRGIWPAAGTDYGIIRYPVASPAVDDTAEIVRMEDSLNISFKLDKLTTVEIKYGFSNTARRYAHPGCYAAFIGILAELSYPNVQSTGMCFEDATSYPSRSHPNGDSIDTIYLETQPKRRAIIAAFIDWGFAQLISSPVDMGDGAHVHNVAHNSHLHAGNFPDANVKVII